jgi:hypothetical protein
MNRVKTGFRDLLDSIKAYISANYVREDSEADYDYVGYEPEARSLDERMLSASRSAPRMAEMQVFREAFVPKLDEPFTTVLLRLIDRKEKTDVEVYKRAGISRKLFSKIRKGKGYMPSKRTVVALAVGLELTLAETRELLERAGFALSRSVIFDVIVEYFITQEIYEVHVINDVLYEYDQPLLGE